MSREYFEREDSRLMGLGPRGKHATAVTYTAVDRSYDAEDEHGRSPYAQVEMSMPREVPNPLRGMVETGQLLRSVPGQITGAYAHTSMGGAIPTLLGMATNRYREAVADSTAVPGHGHSLSTDSSAMVQNLRSSGVDIPVNKTNPGANQTNNIAQEGRSQYTIARSELPGADPIGWSDHPQVKAGAQTMRSLLRQRKPPINPVQFQGEQLRLF